MKSSIFIAVVIITVLTLAYITLDRPWNAAMENWQKYIVGFEYPHCREFGYPPSYFYTGKMNWDKNGVLDSELDIKSGQLNGYWTRYEKGNVWWKGNYRMGYLLEEWRLKEGKLEYRNDFHFNDMVFNRGSFKIFTFKVFGD